jgi:zinc/manganese transport system permease protein
VQLVGVYLVFASLILPALVAKRRGLAAGYLAGTLGYALGLTASALFDLPAGPSAVCGLAVASAVLGLRVRA